jgi:hypothetical protein
MKKSLKFIKNVDPVIFRSISWRVEKPITEAVKYLSRIHALKGFRHIHVAKCAYKGTFGILLLS